MEIYTSELERAASVGDDAKGAKLLGIFVRRQSKYISFRSIDQVDGEAVQRLVFHWATRIHGRSDARKCVLH